MTKVMKIRLTEDVAGRKKGGVYEIVPNEHAEKHGYYIAYESEGYHGPNGFQVQPHQCEIIESINVKRGNEPYEYRGHVRNFNGGFIMNLIKGKNYIITYEDIEGSTLFDGILLTENVGYRRNAYVFYNKENDNKLIVGEKDILNIELAK